MAQKKNIVLLLCSWLYAAAQLCLTLSADRVPRHEVESGSIPWQATVHDASYRPRRHRHRRCDNCTTKLANKQANKHISNDNKRLRRSTNNETERRPTDERPNDHTTTKNESDNERTNDQATKRPNDQTTKRPNDQTTERQTTKQQNETKRN